MNDEHNELYEAIEAGDRALSSLKAAQSELKSAKNWGIIDLLGGELFTDLMKRSKMKKASHLMEAARRELQIFERELRDVDVSSGLHLDTDDFLTFADFFFDGVIADYMMQSRIAEARAAVDEVIVRVTYLLATLQEQNSKRMR